MKILSSKEATSLVSRKFKEKQSMERALQVNKWNSITKIKSHYPKMKMKFKNFEKNKKIYKESICS